MREVRTAIDIAAPREAVWEVLLDWPRYTEWNPFLTNITGEARVGGEIVETIQFTFLRRPILGKSFVTVVRPPEELTWRGSFVHAFHRLGNGTHSFVLERVGGGTRLHHSETYRGLLVPALFALIRGVAEPHFMLMDAALKRRAEGQG